MGEVWIICKNLQVQATNSKINIGGKIRKQTRLIKTSFKIYASHDWITELVQYIQARIAQLVAYWLERLFLGVCLVSNNKSYPEF